MNKVDKVTIVNPETGEVFSPKEYESLQKDDLRKS